jgi:uncharacterized protein with HEPN domain
MKGDQLYLRHILEAIEKIESYISVGHNVFMTTTHWHALAGRRDSATRNHRRSNQETIPGPTLPAS